MNAILLEIQEEIGRAKFVSVLLDEASDVSKLPRL